MTASAYHEQLRNAALDAIARRWPVFLLHGIRDGICTCGNPACRNPGKHPHPGLTPNGLHNATTDEATVGGWLERLPDANLALATGPDAGRWVLDVDVPAGLATIDAAEARHGQLPGTSIVVTGSGGLHLHMAYPAIGHVQTGTNVLGPGVDVRGRGGYVILPPSRHISGGTYRWDRTDDDPDFWRLADAPMWLRAAVMAKEERPAPRTPWTPAGAAVDGAAISEGGRNAALTSKGGAMRRAGFSEAEILAALLTMNADRCRPALDEAEVRKIAHSVARYAPVPMATKPGAFRPVLIQGGKVVA